MIHISYRVTETIHRQQKRIVKLVYDYEENPEDLDLNFMTLNQTEKLKYRHYRATIKRDEYERLIDDYMSENKQLSFDHFVEVLRPIMMGTYDENELQNAFRLLDKNQSSAVHLDEFINFLSIISPDLTKENLVRYTGQEQIYTNEQLSFNQFNDLVLRGIGKDIVCGHI